MLEYIKGVLTTVSPQKIVLETHGIGYKLFVPLSTFTKLPQIGAEVLIYISTIIREDSHKYFGFFTLPERDLFEQLSDISGIGPKTALAIVGHMECRDLEMAISYANVSLLSKIPGIGKKTAERLIVEMRDKIHKMPSIFSITPTSKDVLSQDHMINDALSALTNLGYNPIKARQAIQRALSLFDKQPKLSDLLKAALKET